MDIKFAHRLSYKQARLTVLVGFVLGTLLSLIQIGIDYASEDASINREIRSLIEISHNPASRIAYNIDAELAQELTLGLLHSPAIIRAQLIDNNGVVLADVNRPRKESNYRPVSDFLFGANRQFEDRLFLSHMPNDSLGVLRLDVDTYAFGSRFLHRAEITLLNGFARSLLLTGILLGLFYVMLTQPLVRIIRELSTRKQARLDCPRGMNTMKSACWSMSLTSNLKTWKPRSSNGATPKTASRSTWGSWKISFRRAPLNSRPATYA